MRSLAFSAMKSRASCSLGRGSWSGEKEESGGGGEEDGAGASGGEGRARASSHLTKTVPCSNKGKVEGS